MILELQIYAQPSSLKVTRHCVLPIFVTDSYSVFIRFERIIDETYIVIIFNI